MVGGGWDLAYKSLPKKRVDRKNSVSKRIVDKADLHLGRKEPVPQQQRQGQRVPNKPRRRMAVDPLFNRRNKSR